MVRKRPVQHKRSGYRRRNPNGGYTWVKATTVNKGVKSRRNNLPPEIHRFIVDNKRLIMSIVEQVKFDLHQRGQPYKKDIVASLAVYTLIEKGYISTKAGSFVKIGIMMII
jgi:hypothetical protein